MSQQNQGYDPTSSAARGDDVQGHERTSGVTLAGLGLLGLSLACAAYSTPAGKFQSYIEPEGMGLFSLLFLCVGGALIISSLRRKPSSANDP